MSVYFIFNNPGYSQHFSKLFPMLKQSSGPTMSDSLEERIEKAKSSMSLWICLMVFSIKVYTCTMAENFFI